MEYGLCCLFYNEPIKFRTYTRTAVERLSQTKPQAAKEKVIEIINHNIRTLQTALDYCRDHDINSYRISSDLIPHMSTMRKMNIISDKQMNLFAEQLRNINSHDLILSMHPGQHVNMGSPNQKVIDNSVLDLKEHFWVAEKVGCTEINIHLGGSYGDKKSAIKRFISNMKSRIPADQLKWITLENDELNYSIEDVYNVAKKLGIRATYDIHHQRCYELRYPGSRSRMENYLLCAETWEGYGYQRLHISSPKQGYSSVVQSRPHHDFIQPEDIPEWLLQMKHIHLDIEAKAKEKAIRELRNQLKAKYEKLSA